MAANVLVELAVTICLFGNPLQCKEEILYDQFPTQQMCYTQAQPTIDEFLSTKPNWEFQRFTCREVGSGGVDI